MMDLATIKHLNAEAGNQCKRDEIEPLWLDVADAKEELIGIPYLGDYVPGGWKETGTTYFVDSSGFGSDSEPALTLEQFLDKVEPGYGYGIISQGQFQVYVGQFKRSAGIERS